MTITTLILLLATGIVTVTLVDGSSIKNCCNVATKDYYFFFNKKPSTVYTMLTCVVKELQYRNIVILSLMEEGG